MACAKQRVTFPCQTTPKGNANNNNNYYLYLLKVYYVRHTF